MIVVFFLLSLLGYVMVLHLSFKLSPIFSLWFTLASLLVVLYGATFLDTLRWTAASLYYLGQGLAVFGGVCYLTKYRNLLKEFFSPGICVFIASALLFWVNFHHLSLATWDEFSFWGVYVKELLHLHNFSGTETTGHKDYTRITSLFQYYVLSNTVQEDGMIYFAHFLFLITPLTIYFIHLSWKDFPLILLLGLLSIFLIEALGLGFATIYVDHLLSVWFAMTILVYFHYFTSPRFIMAQKIFLLFPMLFILPLIKKTGFNLAILFSVLVLGDIVLKQIHRHGLSKDILRIIHLSGAKFQILTIVGLVFILSAAPLASYSWKARNQALGISESFSLANVTSSQILHSFSKEASQKESTIIENFLMKLVEPQANHSNAYSFSTIKWMGFASFLFILAFLLKKELKNRTQIGFIWLVLLLGNIGYLFGLLLSYLYVFSEYEGLRLASFYRYSNTFVLAFLLTGVGLVFMKFGGGGGRTILLYKKHKWRLYIFGFAMTVFLYTFFTPPFGILTRKSTMAGDIRVLIRPQIELILSQVREDQKIYIIYQNSSGFEAKIIQYEIFPRLTNGNCFSLGERYYPEDVWTCLLSQEEWETQLNGYDYVFLAKIDEKFIKSYGELFANQISDNDFLFQVKRVNNQIRLLPIKPVSLIPNKSKKR